MYFAFYLSLNINKWIVVHKQISSNNILIISCYENIYIYIYFRMPSFIYIYIYKTWQPKNFSWSFKWIWLIFNIPNMKWNDLWVGGYAHIMFIVRDQGLFIESNKIYISVCWAMEFIATQETLTVLQSNIY